MNTETIILNSLESGILITDINLNIHFWNNWLVTYTTIGKDEALNGNLEKLFPKTSFALLKRKIKVALKLKSSAFIVSDVERFVIPIELQRITKYRFRHMRQDVVITPLDEERVSLVIHDNTALLEAKAEIDEQVKILHKQATTDALTGCYNRKLFNELLSAETSRAIRHAAPCSLVIFDIDDFKSVNDLYGHPVGDSLLIALSQLVASNLRKSDTFARWGGEEFIILLPATDKHGAAVLAEKIRQIISEHNFTTPAHKTCSFGVAEFNTEESAETFVSQADRALYFAKNNGKNQVAIFHSDGHISN